MEEKPSLRTDGLMEPQVPDTGFREPLSSDRVFASNSAEYYNRDSELEE